MARQKPPKTVSQVLYAALKARLDSGTTVYAVHKATGLAQPVIARFVSGERAQIRAATIDALAEYLGLELVPRGK